MDLKNFNNCVHIQYAWVGHHDIAFPSIARQWARQLYAKMMEDSIFLQLEFREKIKRDEEIEKKLEKLFSSSYRFQNIAFHVQWRPI